MNDFSRVYLSFDKNTNLSNRVFPHQLKRGKRAMIVPGKRPFHKIAVPVVKIGTFAFTDGFSALGRCDGGVHYDD